MQVPYVKEGLEAIIFTADGDMRQALNNLQATHFGFGLVDQAAVFKACLLPCLSCSCLAIHISLNMDRLPDVAGALRAWK